MKKLKIIVWDLLGTSAQWIENFLVMERCQILKTIQGYNSRLSKKEIAEYPEWDYILIFSTDENTVLDIVGDCLEETEIPWKKVLFPLLISNLVDNMDISYYIFKDAVRSSLEFNMEKLQNKDYITCTTKEGLSYIAAATDNVIIWSMYTTHINWAESEIKHFFQLSKKYYPRHKNPRYFFDIGANIGTTSVYVKRIMAPDMHIIAFEPVPKIFKLLKLNLLLNDISEKEYTLVNKGISSKSEERTIKYDSENPGGSSFLENPSSQEQVSNPEDTEIAVSTVSLDEFINKHNISLEDIWGFWVDVEGFEAMFLSGGKETLSKLDVPIIMEFTPQLLKQANMYELFLTEIAKLYSHFIIMQDDDKIYPIEELNKTDDRQIDIFLLKHVEPR